MQSSRRSDKISSKPKLLISGYFKPSGHFRCHGTSGHLHFRLCCQPGAGARQVRLQEARFLLRGIPDGSGRVSLDSFWIALERRLHDETNLWSRYFDRLSLLNLLVYHLSLIDVCNTQI